MSSVLGGNFDQEKLTALLNVLYNGTFFTGEEDGGNAGGILTKIDTVTGEVTVLMSKCTTGDNAMFRNVTAYNGKFYFCGAVNNLPCIYELDPETDEITMVYQGMTLQDYYQGYMNGVCTGIRGLCEYDGELILSCVTKDGPVILSSSNPREGFTVIANQQDLFNYPAYHLRTAFTAVPFGKLLNSTASFTCPSAPVLPITCPMKTQCSPSHLFAVIKRRTAVGVGLP